MTEAVTEEIQGKSVFQQIREIRQAVRNMRDRLSGARAVRNFILRDTRMFVLVKDGQCSTKDIIKADFGTKNPNGLDIVHDKDETCVFRNMRDTPGVDEMSRRERKKYMRYGGTAGKGEFINLNDDYINASVPYHGLSNVVSHEHMHRMQARENELGWPSMFSDPSMTKVRGEIRADNVGQKLLHMTRDFNRSVLDFRQKILRKDSVSDYYATSYEMQSRLREVMAQGYAEWQKMPTNKIELWAAMHQSGMKTSLSVLRDLYGTKEGLRALATFKTSRYTRKMMASGVRGLNYAYDFAGSIGRKNTLWREAYPEIYGNMLELMGDRLGRERMDLGKSYRPALDLLERMHDETLMTQDDIDAALDRVPPDVVKPLVYAILDGDAKDHPQRGVVIRSIAEHPALSASLDYTQYDRSRGAGHIFPLSYAVSKEGPDVAMDLIHAGFDPFQQVKSLDLDGNVIDRDYPLLFQLKSYSALKKFETREKKMPRKLRKLFASESYQQDQANMDANIEAFAKRLIAEYPDIDKPVTIEREGTWTETTLRKELEKAGLAAPEDKIGTEENKTVHTGFSA